MTKKTKTRLKEKKVDGKSNKILPLEVILLLLIIVIASTGRGLFYYEVKETTHTFNIFGLNVTSSYNLIYGGFIVSIFIILVLIRFSNDTRAKLSVIIGGFVAMWGLLYPVSIVINYYLPVTASSSLFFYLIYFTSIFKFNYCLIGAIVGLSYGIIGLQSPSKKKALLGIILNAAGFFFLITTILFVIFVSVYGVAP